ncbi:MAG: S8 family serine peptidase [Actinophytocola sp.]|uniref:S8 family serine peptidase n=1 Tax=Actinophytocola sp. TaxID=1872138 RepID=UPI00132B879C|nr:S8 family serine peptidase [Actinophytocola sp.]MPZ82540.1 S8 family serine peptidase [Actinophytocola sp.]
MTRRSTLVRPRARRTVRSATSAAVVALALVSTQALTIAPAAAAQPGGRQVAPAPTVVSQHTVTLVTSDVVDLRLMSDGDATATVRPAEHRSNVSYATRKIGDSLYVVPSDAMALIAAGKLDEELFNVSALVAGGHDDAGAENIPLIVQYAPSRARAAATAVPPGTSAGLTLESINAKSVREDKGKASTFWTSLAGTGEGTTAAAADVRKIWLNRSVQVTLTDSVPQVGAPQAWEAGYDGTGVKVAVLDTGIDTTHPDLDDGKVVAEANFSTDTDTLDHYGHGTHVASIVAGTGEGSPAGRKGVAPGANLINAKVLNSGGSGEFAGIIEGLEWAAAQGADVANMSLGTNAPSDGNDPLVQAVDAISASSDMLVVVAAGNLGNGESTIASPGWADAALTVGAVDKQDALAGFSSRGPRLGDYGIKPDITAPGVDIVAARAEGTTLGPIVDGNYQQLSGTSMATPHVAGAAAILAQRFPDYGGEQIKDTLIATSETQAGQTVHQQGGGRLDVARGYTQEVYASPGTLNLGYFTYPHTGQEPVTKTVTYSNDTDAELTLDLSLRLSGKESGPAPEGMFTVSASSVTVPAGGTADVTVTVDPSAGSLDLYGGYLVATGGDDTVVHTSVGAYVEPEMYNLTVSGIARDGRPAAVISWAELWSLATGSFEAKYYSQTSSTVTFRVRPGTYNLAGYLATADAANVYALEVATVAEPQLEISGDTSITLDARTANRLVLNTKKATAPATFTLSYHRDLDEKNFHSSFTLSPPISRGYATPTETVTKGYFEFYSRWDLVAPPLLAQVTKPQKIPLDPQPMSYARPVDGVHKLPVVYVGLGKPEDYTGRDVRGKIALISRGETTFAEKVANATAAGAFAAVVFNNAPGLLLAGAGQPGEVSIRAFTLDQDPGLMLVDLLKQGPVTMQVSGTSVSPYFYDLLLPEAQRVPASLTYDINRRNTAEIATRYRADTSVVGTDVRHISRPWPTFSVGFAREIPRPLTRTYYVSANDTDWWHIAWSNYPFDGEFHSGYTRYQPKTTLSEDWFGRVSRPGATALLDTRATRTDDELELAILPFSDAGGHHGWAAAGDVLSTKLYSGSTLLAQTTAAPIGTFPVLAEPATYRLVFNGKRDNAWSRYSTETNTTWTFASRRGEEHPALPQVGYDLDLDTYNQAPERSTFGFTVNAGHVPGVDGPAIRTVKAWVSFNDGATWKKVDLTAQGAGSFGATVKHPRLASTSGAVSLRVAATDTAGNSIDQTIIRAYGLKPVE